MSLSSVRPLFIYIYIYISRSLIPFRSGKNRSSGAFLGKLQLQSLGVGLTLAFALCFWLPGSWKLAMPVGLRGGTVDSPDFSL